MYPKEKDILHFQFSSFFQFPSPILHLDTQIIMWKE